MARKWIVALLLAATMGATTVASASTSTATAPASSSGGVTVTVTVRPTAYCTEIEPGVVQVRANHPWTLTSQTPDGVTTVGGGVTAGTRITLPEGTISYAVALD